MAKKDRTQMAAEQLITRNEAAARIGISVQELRRRQMMGQITPVRDTGPMGSALYRVADIDSFAEHRIRTRSNYSPEDAAKVFKLLSEGKTAIQCVSEAHVLPPVVEELAFQYASLSGSMFLPSEILKKINAMELDGPLPLMSPEDLIEVMELLINQRCLECAKKPRAFCKSCVQEAIKGAKEKAQGVDEL